MSKLAKFGIMGGRAVPVEGLMQAVNQREQMPEYLQCSFDAFGLVEIAQKVSEGKQLNSSELLALLDHCPLAALMKLVELHGSGFGRLNIEPAIYLPLEEWIRTDDIDGALDQALERLSCAPDRQIWIFTDLIDFSDLESEWPELLFELKREFPEAKIIAPPVGVLLKWINYHRRIRKESDVESNLKSILELLSKIGFYGLAESTFRTSIGCVKSTGFDVSVLTRLDRNIGSESIIKEFDRVSELARIVEGDLSWSVGVPTHKGRDRFYGGSLDITVMRVMAVGVLAMPNVKVRRVYSRFLQYETFGLISKFGANERAFASIDRETSERFGWPLLDLIPDDVVKDLGNS